LCTACARSRPWLAAMPRIFGARAGSHRDDDTAGEIELEPMVGRAKPNPTPVAIAAPDERQGFVRKVYGILSVQLLATLLFSSVIVRHGREWLHTNPSAMLGAMTASSIMALGVAAVASCCPFVLRRFPENYALLVVLTVAESILVGFACLQYSTGSIILCCGLTAAVVLGLTVFAARSKTDFTGLGPYFLSFLLVLTLFGFVLSMMATFGHAAGFVFNGLEVLYAAGGALAASMFLVFDTQLILGGGHEHEFSVDDYAMAALCIYLDVIQLFLSLLRLLGRSDDDGL